MLLLLDRSSWRLERELIEDSCFRGLLTTIPDLRSAKEDVFFRGRMFCEAGVVSGCLMFAEVFFLGIRVLGPGRSSSESDTTIASLALAPEVLLTTELEVEATGLRDGVDVCWTRRDACVRNGFPPCDPKPLIASVSFASVGRVVVGNVQIHVEVLISQHAISRKGGKGRERNLHPLFVASNPSTNSNLNTYPS